MQAAWSSWRKLAEVLYDRKIPLRLKAKVYEATIRSALKYGSECWAMKVNNKKKIVTTVMRMPRGIIGVSRRDHMRKEEIRRLLHLSPIDEAMRSGCLRWFGHAQRTDANNVTHRVMDLTLPGTRRRGHPKNTFHQRMRETVMVGCGYCPAVDPRPEGVEKEDTSEPTDLYRLLDCAFRRWKAVVAEASGCHTCLHTL